MFCSTRISKLDLWKAFKLWTPKYVYFPTWKNSLEKVSFEWIFKPFLAVPLEFTNWACERPSNFGHQNIAIFRLLWKWLIHNRKFRRIRPLKNFVLSAHIRLVYCKKSYQMMDLANESGTKMFLLGFEIQGDPAELEFMFQNLRTVDFDLDECILV